MGLEVAVREGTSSAAQRNGKAPTAQLTAAGAQPATQKAQLSAQKANPTAAHDQPAAKRPRLARDTGVQDAPLSHNPAPSPAPVRIRTRAEHLGHTARAPAQPPLYSRGPSPSSSPQAELPCSVSGARYRLRNRGAAAVASTPEPSIAPELLAEAAAAVTAARAALASPLRGPPPEEPGGAASAQGGPAPPSAASSSEELLEALAGARTDVACEVTALAQRLALLTRHGDELLAAQASGPGGAACLQE
jgi:hypothetical protein